jgi:hypothetical protein
MPVNIEENDRTTSVWVDSDIQKIDKSPHYALCLYEAFIY